MRALLQGEAIDEWKSRLEHPSAGHWTVEAVRPVLHSWLDRPHGALSRWLTQLLTGHGSLGHFLWRVVGREPTAECHECGAPDDTAQHTLVECPAWTDERVNLCESVGKDLNIFVHPDDRSDCGNVCMNGDGCCVFSLPVIIRSMIGSERVWSEVASFCEGVMLCKEAAERERERTTSLDIRRPRHRRRRDAFEREERDAPLA